MRVSEGLGRDVLRLIVWYPMRWLVERLPPRLGLAVLAALGTLHAALARGRKARLEAAVAAVSPRLPAPGRGRQAREFFRTHYVNQLSLFVFPKLTRQNCEELLEIEGLPNLDAVLIAGRGVVLPIGHCGPTQLPLAVLGLLGYPMLQIGFLNGAGLSFIGRHVALRLRRIYEARIPAAIVPPGPGARQALAHLRAGGVVMTTADDGPGQPPFGRHAIFDFPGGPLAAPLGPARLALAAGAALCPAFLVPGPGRRGAPYRLILDAPMEVPGISDSLTGKPVSGQTAAARRDAAALAMTRDFLVRYAAVVAACPGWWHGLETHIFP